MFVIIKNAIRNCKLENGRVAEAGKRGSAVRCCWYGKSVEWGTVSGAGERGGMCGEYALFMGRSLIFMRGN